MIQAGCDALLSCNEQVELRSSVEDHNVYCYILDAMKRHGSDPYLAGKAVDTLASLSTTGNYEFEYNMVVEESDPPYGYPFMIVNERLGASGS